MSADQVLKEVAQEVSVCTKCELHIGRKLAVPGEGPAQAEILLIGEGPGFHENEKGRPFIGASGKLLSELLEKIGMSRAQVFITNIVKCRPPGNRDPKPEEIETCTSNYLFRQIETINPKVIVTLGRHSMGLFFPNVRIGEVHGQAQMVKGRLVVPMYHPAAALHQGNLKPVLEADFSKLPQLISQVVKPLDNRTEPNDYDEDKPNPQQLNLF